MPNRAGLIMAGESNLGLQRKRNEDNFCCYLPVDRANALAVVADGVGGHSNGGIASLICCRDMTERFAGPDGRAIADSESAARFLADAIEKINHKIYGRNCLERELRPMSSTIIAAIFLPGEVVLANAGDSRMYEFHPESGLLQLSTDHTYSAEFEREHGYLPPNAENMTNLIVKAVGTRSALEPELKILPRRPDSRYLLASDGATGCVNDDRLRVMMEEARTPRALVNLLMRNALLHGARDNVTVISVFPTDNTPGAGA